jgi:hypothetical protein
MIRKLLLAVTLTITGFACTGAAASLGGAGAPSLGAGSAAVGECDTDGFGVTHATAAGRVATVTVSGIADPGCSGGALRVQLTSGGTAAGGGGPVTVAADGDTGDDSVAVTISPQPLAHEVDGFSVSVVGP